MKRNTDISHSYKRAVALQYDAVRHDAPVVSAKGVRKKAEEMIHLARQHNIPIQEDPALIELLAAVDIHQEIPETLYDVVAELLAMIYKMEKQAHQNEHRQS